MRQRHRIVGDGDGILSRGHRYRLYLMPILGCERQFRYRPPQLPRLLAPVFRRSRPLSTPSPAPPCNSRCRPRESSAPSGYGHAALVIVGDYARRLAIFDRCVGSVDQHDRQCLRRFIYIVVDDGVRGSSALSPRRRRSACRSSSHSPAPPSPCRPQSHTLPSPSGC